MKSLNNLLLLGDGETWARQKIDFAGLPQIVQTFLQVAAGAADIPVARLLGQSPAGLSATGDSDTRNYYDMIAARQTIDLRPQLEKLDRCILRSAGVDPANVSFCFRPLWQMDAASAATIALNKAQATQIYAGLNLWPAAVTARLVASQLIEDGVYPGAAAIFGEANVAGGVVADAEPGDAGQDDRQPAVDFFNPAQLRDPNGRWAKEGGGSSSKSLPIILVNSSEGEEEEKQINATGGPVPSTEQTKAPTPRINLAPQPVSGPPQTAPFMSAPAASMLPPLTAKSAPPTVGKPVGIPANWIERPTKKKGGTQWSDPKNGNNVVRSMPADPNSPYPHQQVPYVVDQNGSFRDISGKPINRPDAAYTPEAHIPFENFIFRRP